MGYPDPGIIVSFLVFCYIMYSLSGIMCYIWYLLSHEKKKPCFMGGPTFQIGSVSQDIF